MQLETDTLSTIEAARRLKVKPHTLRTAYCRHGSYFGAVPVKAVNRMLHWLAEDIERLARGERIEPKTAAKGKQREAA